MATVMTIILTGDIPMSIATERPTALQGSALLRLLTWLSPSFPVGAYTYSHGIEYAVEVGLIKDRQSLVGWLESILVYGTAQTDAVLFARGYEAADTGEDEALWKLFELADAMRGTREMALESSAQGAAFWQMLTKVWPDKRFDRWQQRFQEERRKPAYPLAVAVAAVYHQIPLEEILFAYLHATAANLVSAGVRLVPLGQTAGQEATAGLEEVMLAAASKALATDINDIGSATPMVNIRGYSDHEFTVTNRNRRPCRFRKNSAPRCTL